MLTRLLACSLLLFSLSAPAGRVAAEPASGAPPVPILAYYYIWFDPSSWSHAKTDVPALGPYSSDDSAVLRQHIQWASQAGLNGFLVSWKNTPALTRRLADLAAIAAQENFKLSIIYQGLNVARRPLPAAQIAADLDYFINRFAGDPTFGAPGKPLVIWSGTWEFSPEDVAAVTTPRRSSLLILASERNLPGYERLADSVDGNAYYWSSVDPDKDRGFAEKLSAMGQAVHAHGGLWIAPAAAGFDARLIGGTRVVDRQGGDTLRREMNAAMASSPDAVGLISWNEFTENSYVEPSQNFGSHYLTVVSDILSAQRPATDNFDSSDPGTTDDGSHLGWLGALAALVVPAPLVIARRGRRARGSAAPSGDDRRVS
jgi:NAD(P)H-dependent FMN reductase